MRTAAEGPVIAEHVLVEVFAGPHAEEEAAGHERSGGGGRLGDDRRVDPDRRAGDAGPDAQPFGGLGQGAEDTPHEG